MKKNIIYTIFFTFFTSSLLSCADGNVNQANESALFNAVCTKKLYEVRMVLSTLAKHPKGRAASLALINQHNQEGNTALISAVDNRSLSIVQALMQAGANPHMPNKNGRSAIDAAQSLGHHDINQIHRRILNAVSKKKDSQEEDETQEQRLQQLPSYIHSLINNQDSFGLTLLNEAAASSNLQRVRMLLQAGADVNVPDNAGLTPLHNATTHDIAQALLNAGAQVNTQSPTGFTPLNQAIVSGYLRVAQVLIHAGADVNIPDQTGLTPLNNAVIRGHTNIARNLMHAGANINIPDPSSGLTPLHNAVIYNHPGIVQDLIYTGADLNRRDEHGFTSIHKAILLGHDNLIYALIEGGADVNIADNLGFTPLHNATTAHLIHILLRAGADKNKRNHQGFTAIDFARMYVANNQNKDNLEILKILMTPQPAKTQATQTDESTESLSVQADISCSQGNLV